MIVGIADAAAIGRVSRGPYSGRVANAKCAFPTLELKLRYTPHRNVLRYLPTYSADNPIEMTICVPRLVILL